MNTTTTTNEILPSIDRSTPLFDLTSDQIETLETWYRELHGYIDCDSLRSILGNGRMWQMTLGDWISQEVALAAESAAE